MNFRGAFELDALTLRAGGSTLGRAAPLVMPVAKCPQVFKAVVISVIYVVALKLVSIPASLAVLLDDHATVAVPFKDGLPSQWPVGRESLLTGGSLPRPYLVPKFATTASTASGWKPENVVRPGA